MSISKRIAFGVAASWFSRAVTILLGLLLLPVLFRHMPKEEIGVWLLLGQSWAALGIFDFGFGVTLTRRIAFAKGKSGTDPNVTLTGETIREIADLMATGKVVYRALAIFAFVSSMAASFFYLRTLHLGSLSLFQVWVAWGVLCMSQAFSAWANIWNAALSGIGYVGWDAVLASLASALTLSVQIILVLLGGGLVALAIAAAVGTLSQRFLLLGFARRRRPEIFAIRGHCHWALIKDMSPLALRAWLTAVGYTLAASSDQFFIASYEGAQAIPAYRAAFLLVINLHFAAGVFAGASQVFISHLWQDGQFEEIRILLKRNMLISMLSMGCGCATLLGLGPVIFDFWLGPGNFIGYPILTVFIATFLLEQHANVFSFSGRATEDEAYAWTSLAAGLLKIPLALFGIKYLGLWGLALSTLLAQGFTNSWFMVYRSAQRLGISLIQHLYRVLLPCVAVSVVAFLAAMAANESLAGHPPISKIVAVMTVTGTILALSLWTLVLPVSQREALINKALRRNSPKSESVSRRAIFISRVYGSHHGGSIYLEALVAALADEGWAVTLASEQFGPTSATKKSPSFGRLTLPSFFKREFLASFFRLADIVRLVHLIRRERIGLIIVQGDLPRLTYIFLQYFIPLIFIRQDGILTCPANTRFLRKSRTICHKPVGFSCLAVHQKEHCFGSLNLVQRVRKIVYRTRDQFLLKRLKNFVANSEYILDAHLRHGSVLYPPRLSTSPIVRSERDLTRLAFCARLESVKGAEDAIRILSHLPENYHLEILGDGPGLDALQKLAENLGVRSRLTFHGWVDRARRDEVFASSAALLMPSLWDEAFGMVGLEAFAQGTPVVAYDVGGISEWCQPTAGLLVPCGDTHKAATAVRTLTSNLEDWQKFSQGAKAVAESRFTLTEFQRRTLEIVERSLLN